MLAALSSSLSTGLACGSLAACSALGSASGALAATPTSASPAPRAAAAPRDAQDDRSPDASASDPSAPVELFGERDARYGFRAFEIYRVGAGTSSLVLADFDGDGLGDLALVDNHRSRIEVLRRIGPRASDAEDPDREHGPNVPAFDGRFVRTRHPVERRVLDLAAHDWNGDGRAELAWVAEGGELGVLWSDAKGGAALETRRPVDALRNGCVGMLAADTDRDGREELCVLAPDALLAFAPRADGFGAPRVVDRFESAPARAFVAEVDGAGGSDLVYAYLETDAPLRYRLAREGGFGPRVDVEMPQLRGVELAPRGAREPADILAVFKLSGRLSLRRFAPLPPGRRALHRHPFGASEKRTGHSFVCGDLDGDGAGDVVVAEPDAASLSVWHGTRGGIGLESRSYPTLTGVHAPRLADLDGDGRREIVCVSAKERMLGVMRPTAPRELGFPQTLPIDGEPVALEVGDVDADGKVDVVVLVAQGEGRARKHRLEVRTAGAGGALGEPRVHALEGLKKSPDALRLHDLDRDGKLDLLAFAPGEKAVPALILQRADGSFVADERGEDAPGLGILAGAGPDAIAASDVDLDGKPELWVAQANFVRALAFELDASGRAVPRVLEQCNLPSADARLAAIACADWDGDGRTELVVRDEATRELLVCSRENGALEVQERAAASRLESAGLAAADCNGDGRLDVVQLARDQIAVLTAGGRENGFEEVASYDPRDEKVHLGELATGDLGADAGAEIVATEASRHALLVLRREAGRLAHCLGFAVFEKKSFEDDNFEREPREIRCGDIDGDGRADLAVLVHDKLIVYLQE